MENETAEPPRTRVRKRSCGSNCGCDINSEVIWPDPHAPGKVVKKEDEKTPRLTADVMKQFGSGKQLAAAIRKITPTEDINSGIEEMLKQLEIDQPVHVCEISDEDGILVSETQEWPEVEFEVALDSGSVVHVCSNEDTLGYLLEPSPGSRRAQMFMMQYGNKIPNEGQTTLQLGAVGQNSEVKSTFQIAQVTRPLMSVGGNCLIKE